jgi:hypothetical protein
MGEKKYYSKSTALLHVLTANGVINIGISNDHFLICSEKMFDKTGKGTF